MPSSDHQKMLRAIRRQRDLDTGDHRLSPVGGPRAVPAKRRQQPERWNKRRWTQED